MQRLSRTAQPQTASRRLECLPAMPFRAEVHFTEASFSQNRIPRRSMRRMSHACADLHGYRRTPRPQPPYPSPRPVSEAWDVQLPAPIATRTSPLSWALLAADKWWPEQATKGLQHFAETLHAGSIGAPGAEQSLGELVTHRDQPAIARATALSMLATYNPPSTDSAIRAGVADDSALLRRAAVRAFSNSDPRASAVTLSLLLHDPVRVVRLEAAEVLAGTPPDAVPSGVGLGLNNSFDEYIASQELNADRPEAHLNLRLLHAKEHDLARAEAELKIALSLAPSLRRQLSTSLIFIADRTGMRTVNTSSRVPSVVRQTTRRFNTRSVC